LANQANSPFHPSLTTEQKLLEIGRYNFHYEQRALAEQNQERNQREAPFASYGFNVTIYR